MGKSGMKIETRNVSGRATLSDVALAAGVSTITVSRALRHPEIVSDELRNRVMKAVKDLAYIPNQMASALASARTGRIGVIVPSFTNGVFGDFLQGIHDVMVPSGFQVVMLNSNYVSGQEEAAIFTMLGQFPEALILTGVAQTAQARRALMQSGIPLIQTQELPEEPLDICIGFSQEMAGHAAASHLIDLGHRNLGAVFAPHDDRSIQRRSGFERAAREAGIKQSSIIVDAPSSVPLGGDLLMRIMKNQPGMTALFCGNDNMALGALFECQRRGIAVPGDLSIIGFNDLEFSASACPALSTVVTPRYEMGTRSGEIILEIVRGSGMRPVEKRIDLGFRLIGRDSTAPPRMGT
jgi:LacI family gluconate utilization system Gnt-I transcriptional repressor